MKLSMKQLHKRQKGFTLTELLVVAAIIVILALISIPAMGALRKSLRQRELDSKAEIIYMAAQSRLTQLRTGGFAESYGKRMNNTDKATSQYQQGEQVNVAGVYKDGLPLDAVNENGEAENLCYVIKDADGAVGGDAAYTVLPQDSVDGDLWSHYWLIEYDPETGVVYAVFYSEEPMLALMEAEARYITKLLNPLRGESKNRLDAGAKVGYYGGDLTQINVMDPDQMRGEVKITNNEKLTAEFYCYSADAPETFQVTIKDSAGNSYVKNFSQIDLKQLSTNVYRAQWVLDSLDSEKTSFYRQTEGKLLCGTKITVSLHVERKLSGGGRLTADAEAEDNSLFANWNEDPSAVHIAYARHLQNLDNGTSHVLTPVNGKQNAITKAVQVSDISFLDSDTGSEAYHTVYPNRPLFTPIHNEKLTSYVGQRISVPGQAGGIPSIKGLRIESEESSVGLFSTFAGTIQDLLMTGPKVTGGVSNVGTLIGSTTSARKTEIRNVQVFLSEKQGDLQTTYSKVEDVTPWLSGRNAGGLVGSASAGELYIANSSASMPLEADRYAGGLVGTVNCKTTVLRSYADAYLQGAYVGGLIGGAGSRAQIILSDFYAAGYGIATQAAAGFVVFQEDYNPIPLRSAYNGYSAMDLTLKKGSEDGVVYSTAPRCYEAVRVYYLGLTGVNAKECTHMDGTVNTGVEKLTYGVLSSKDALYYTVKNEDGTTKDESRLLPPFKLGSKGTTQAYNLVNQGLSVYSYPKLDYKITDSEGAELTVDLPHYGDWQAQFEEGALVYFEKDERGLYRFVGGNISIDQINADASEPDYAKRHKIVADGYALAYSANDNGSGWRATAYLGGKQQDLTKTQKLQIDGYTLYKLSEELLNNDQAAKDSTGFYQQLRVEEGLEGKSSEEKATVNRYYYLNPNFASCIGSENAKAPDVVRIRSARQLYALSRLYETYVGKSFFTKDTVFRQEMDLDYAHYNWEDFFDAKVKAVSAQEPIGSDDVPFRGTYDGMGNTIQGLGILTTQKQTGFFGRIDKAGTVANLVLLGEWSTDDEEESYSIVHKEQENASDETSVANGVKTVNMGALAGLNEGSITNCAAVGYRMKVSVYNGATVNVGGLVGRNHGGSIYNSSAETPLLYLRDYAANIYAGGFVGDNSGSVYNSYCAGYLEVAEAKLETKKNTLRISGFAAKNDNGNLVRCYAGVPMMGSGDTEMFGFTREGGTVIQCYYLDEGTYEYRGEIYSMNISESGADYAKKAKGWTTTAAGLHQLVLEGFSRANEAKAYLGNDSKVNYQYPAALTRNGQSIHFGCWPNQDKDMGTFGVFYWEYEQNGNTGYHISYQGVSNGVPIGGSTLCTAHDDGGVITEYGYGYFYKPTANPKEGERDPLEPWLKMVNSEFAKGSAVTEDYKAWEYQQASKALKLQMPQYQFVAFKTSDASLLVDVEYAGIYNGLHMGEYEGDDLSLKQNAVWKLCYPYELKNGKVVEEKSDVYTYSVSPFFGDAFSLVGIRRQDEEPQTQNNGILPGQVNDKAYEVRSVAQLQFINWNCGKVVATASVSFHNSDNENNYRYCRFPYLSYGHPSKTSKRIDSLYWKQTHDLDGTGWKNYTPIGSMKDGNGDGRAAKVTLAYFSSTYDGQSYAIKNISISSKEQCVGIFGAASGATIKNVIVYTDNGATIVHEAGAKSWYAVGGLVGLAGAPTGSNAEITNCTVSGYTIADYQTAAPGWGGACIGGLAGVSTMNLTNCTAVSNISVDIGYNASWQNVRVGGLVGCARGTINGCYAGGSITNPNSKKFKLQSEENSDPLTRIWVGGILGGNVLRDGDPNGRGNLYGLIGDTSFVTDVRNCYSFVDIPKSQKDGGIGLIRSSMAIATNGEMLAKCADVQNDYIEIYNCYALDSTAKNSNDYDKLRQWKQGSEGINLNWINSAWVGRRVQMYNDYNPIVSYNDMTQSDFREHLNAKIGGDTRKFDTVTTEENTASINGKYSFPGNNKMLVGLDYPFPTILIQTDVSGNTVNVHYGEWPTFGIYWEEHKATLDLVAARNTSGHSLLAIYDAQEDTEENTELPEQAEPETTEETPPETTVPETTVPETTVPETVALETSVLEAPAAETPAPEELEASSEKKSEEPAIEETGENVLPEALLALDARSLEATLSYKLYVAGIETGGISEPQYELQDQDGNPLTTEEQINAAPARILFHESVLDGDHFNVTFLGQRPGTVRVKATVTKGDRDYEALLVLTVTADLKIQVDEDKLPLKAYEGDAFEDVKVSLQDTNGKQFKPGETAKLEWSLSIDAQESANALVTWSKDAFMTTKDMPVADGSTEKVSYLTSLEGFSAGEGSLRLTLHYIWDDTGEVDPVDTAVSIPVVVYPSDVLGLGDGTAAREVTIPHTPKDGTFTDTPRENTKDMPSAEGEALFLYASNNMDSSAAPTSQERVSYTDLAAFQVEKAELKLGGDYQEMVKAASEEHSATEDYTFQVDETHAITMKISRSLKEDGARNGNFLYRPITVEGDVDAQWSLRLTLRPPANDGGTTPNRTYVLEYHRPNTVIFAWREAPVGTADPVVTLLKPYRVEQGGDLSQLNQDELDAELKTLAAEKNLYDQPSEGQHWTWVIPEGTISENQTVTQKESPIRYYVAYDAGYEDYEWDDNVPMERSVFYYGQDDHKRLTDNSYQRPGYIFSGWETRVKDSATVFADGQAFTDKEIFDACGKAYEHNLILTLYAVWKPQEYYITYNGNFEGWEAQTPMERTLYTVNTPAGDALPECTFQREGYTFLGWAYELDAQEEALKPNATVEQAMRLGGEYVVYKDVTLYAVWKENSTQQDGDEAAAPPTSEEDVLTPSEETEKTEETEQEESKQEESEQEESTQEESEQEESEQEESTQEESTQEETEPPEQTQPIEETPPEDEEKAREEAEAGAEEI